MAIDLIHDRGRGPEIIGTRITVYNLLPDFLDPSATEASIGQMYDLTPNQVAAARAYILNNLDTVLAEHLRIDARMVAGNSQEVIEQAKKTHDAFVSFKNWLVQRQLAEAKASASEKATTGSDGFPTFREWAAGLESRSVKGS